MGAGDNADDDEDDGVGEIKCLGKGATGGGVSSVLVVNDVDDVSDDVDDGEVTACTLA